MNGKLVRSTATELSTFGTEARLRSVPTLSKPRALARGASNGLVSAKELATRSNSSYAAINNYTDMGLLEIVAKNKRLRMYDFKLAQERLFLITKLISEGYTLRIIRKLLA